MNSSGEEFLPQGDHRLKDEPEPRLHANGIRDDSLKCVLWLRPTGLGEAAIAFKCGHRPCSGRWTFRRKVFAVGFIPFENCGGDHGQCGHTTRDADFHPGLPGNHSLAAMRCQRWGALHVSHAAVIFLVGEAEMAPSVISVPANRRPTC